MENSTVQSDIAHLPISAQLEGVERLGLEVGIAHDVIAGARIAIVGRNLFERGRLEGVAITTLDYQVVTGFPHQVSARADLAAEDLVMIVACARGESKTMPQADLVLQEQGMMVGLVRPAGQFGVSKLLAAQLAAACKAMAAPGSAGKAVDHLFLHVLGG